MAGVSGSAGGLAGSQSFGGTSGASATPAAGAGGAEAGSPGVAGAAGASAGGTSVGGMNAGGSGGMNAGGSGGMNAGGGGNAGSGGSLTDCAGHALSLSANGSGNASDAAKARVEINMMSDLPINSANRTIELWAYMKADDWTGNRNTLFFYGPFPSSRNADGFGLDFGNPSNSIGSIDPFTNALFDNDNQPSGVNITTSQWVHFAMTWDGTQVRAYVNGVQRSSKTSDSQTQKVLKTGTSVFTIGGYPGENAYFADYVDEFRIWNVAHSAAEILATKDKTLLGSEAGLVGYWKFNETSGTSAADSVTVAGHTAHPGTLMATSNNQVPSFVVPNPAAPVSCP